LVVPVIAGVVRVSVAMKPLGILQSFHANNGREDGQARGATGSGSLSELFTTKAAKVHEGNTCD